MTAVAAPDSSLPTIPPDAQFIPPGIDSCACEGFLRCVAYGVLETAPSGDFHHPIKVSRFIYQCGDCSRIFYTEFRLLNYEEL